MAKIVLTDSDIKAFPGAEGFGNGATGARGLSNVYFITNTNASGAGSARQAFEDASANGGGWVIPRVAGTVDFTHFFYLGPSNGNAANITYVGQAAPYQGLQFRAAATTGTDKELRVTGSNFIIRHLKSSDANNAEADGLKVGWPAGNHPMENIMLDHISVRGAISRTLVLTTKLGGTYTPAGTYIRNLSITNSLFSESIPPAPMHVLFFGENITKVSIIKNLFTNTKERHLLASGVNNEYEMLNNYFYNFWEAHTAYPRQKIDAIGNVYDQGNIADSSSFTYRIVDCSTNACPPSGDNDYTGTQTWYEDNKDNSQPGDNPNYDTEWQLYKQAGRILGGSYQPMPSGDVKAHLLANAGAGVGTAQGRDSYDSTKVNEVQTTTGARPTGRITIPTLTSGGAGAAYTDSSGNGLSDAYETANGGGLNIQDRPATAVLTNGTIIDQSGVTPGIRYTHGDIFFAELAGDWNNFAPASGGVIIDPGGSNVSGAGGGMSVTVGN